MSDFRLKCLWGSCVAAVLAVHAGSLEAKDISIQELTPALERLRGLSIDSQTTEDNWDAKAGKWVSLPSGVTLSATMAFDESKRYKFVFDPIVTVWKDGKAPYFEEHTTFCFDGIRYFQATYEHGPLGKLHSLNHALISANAAPLPANIHIYTGEEFFLSEIGIMDNVGGTRVAELFTLPSKGDAFDYWLSKSSNGSPYWVLTVHFYENHVVSDADNIWLDPSRGFAMVKRTTERDIGKPNYTCDVSEIASLRQIADHVWYPERVSRTSYEGEKLQPSRKLSFIATSVHFNPSFVPSDFELKLKPGFLVRDDRFGVTFRVGEAVANTIQNITKDVNDAAAANAH